MTAGNSMTQENHKGTIETFVHLDSWNFPSTLFTLALFYKVNLIQKID